mgnify:CR=1 FL=1
MSTTLEEVLEKVASLAPQEQAILLVRVHELVNPPDPDWAQAWAAECHDRLEAFERGEIETFDTDEMMAELKAKYGLR